MVGQTLPKIRVVVSIVFVSMTLAACSAARAQDNVFLKTGGSRSKISGKVSSISPTTVVVTSGGKSTDVPSGSIRKIVYGSEPAQLDRARDRFEDGRFDDCMGELEKIDSPAKSANMLQEIAYLNAFSAAEISLRGGNITAQNAGKTMVDFVRDYPQSYRFFQATELLGRLFEAVGLIDRAEKEFIKLTQSDWPEQQTKGWFYLGNAQLKLKNFADAKMSFDNIAQIDANDDITLKYKQLSECLSAKADAMSGNAAAAKTAIEAIIKRENPDNELLFAHLYNALGACNEATEDWTEAATSYLHTELLFAADPDAHAEALKRLSEIWPKLEQMDRANRAKTTLKSRYRNSFWAKQP